MTESNDESGNSDDSDDSDDSGIDPAPILSGQRVSKGIRRKRRVHSDSDDE